MPLSGMKRTFDFVLMRAKASPVSKAIATNTRDESRIPNLNATLLKRAHLFLPMSIRGAGRDC